MVKNSDKEKYVYSGYGIALDGKVELNFGNDLAKNIIIFVIDNSSSVHTDNLKSDFLNLGEGLTFGIKEDLVHQKGKIDIDFSKAKTKFCLR